MGRTARCGDCRQASAIVCVELASWNRETSVKIYQHEGILQSYALMCNMLGAFLNVGEDGESAVTGVAAATWTL